MLLVARGHVRVLAGSREREQLRDVVVKLLIIIRRARCGPRRWRGWLLRCYLRGRLLPRRQAGSGKGDERVCARQGGGHLRARRRVRLDSGSAMSLPF